MSANATAKAGILQTRRCDGGDAPVAMCARTRLSAGPFLMCVYLLEGIIGKSQLEIRWGPTWQAHQVASLLLIALLSAYVCQAIKHRTVRYGESKAHRAITVMLWMFVVWGGVGSILQEGAVKSTVCYAIFAGMIVHSVIFPRVCFDGMRPERVVRIISVLLITGMLGCCVSVVVRIPPPMWGGRLRGVFYSPILASRMLALCILSLLWWQITFKDHRRLVGAMLVVSVALLVLTRTRTAIASVIVSSMCIVAHRFTHGGRSARLLIVAITLTSGVGAVAMMNRLSPDDISDARSFLRVDGAVENMADERMMYWERGLESLRLTPDTLLGHGYLAAFGGGTGDFASSHYDRDSNRHNMLLSCLQSYGIVGVCLFCLFVGMAFCTFVTHRGPLAALGLAVLAYASVIGITGNCLLSFGDPADRCAWLLLGICLSCADDASNRPTRARPPWPGRADRTAWGITR